MSEADLHPPPEEPDTARAQAAAWVARLQRADRGPELEQSFRRWFEADPEHAQAFARATEIWEAIGGVAPADARRKAPTARRRMAPLAAGLMALALTAGWWGFLRDPVYATGVGEQRVVRLADGSRVALNTDTRISVHYSKGERRLRLDRGEAMFDVAKNPARPFIVSAEGEQVRALGTSFVVRKAGSVVDVTLIEGRVTVSGATPSGPVALTPGQRLHLADTRTPARVDRPRLEAVTAWRRGEILLDNTPLSEAVAELNRYSPTPLVLETPRIASLRVTGIFRTGDSDAFARTVSAQYSLALMQRDVALTLAEAPSPQ